MHRLITVVALVFCTSVHSLTIGQRSAALVDQSSSYGLHLCDSAKDCQNDISPFPNANKACAFCRNRGGPTKGYCSEIIDTPSPAFDWIHKTHDYFCINPTYARYCGDCSSTAPSGGSSPPIPQQLPAEPSEPTPMPPNSPSQQPTLPSPNGNLVPSPQVPSPQVPSPQAPSEQPSVPPTEQPNTLPQSPSVQPSVPSIEQPNNSPQPPSEQPSVPPTAQPKSSSKFPSSEQLLFPSQPNTYEDFLSPKKNNGDEYQFLTVPQPGAPSPDGSPSSTNQVLPATPKLGNPSPPPRRPNIYDQDRTVSVDEGLFDFIG